MICLCVLAFELPFFRSAGETLCTCPFADASLPRAVHGVDLELAPILVLPRVGPPRLDGRRMDPEVLARDLETIRRNWEMVHAGEPAIDLLLVAADRGTRWGELRPLLAAAARVGYRPDFVIEIEDVERGEGFEWSRFR